MTKLITTNNAKFNEEKQKKKMSLVQKIQSKEGIAWEINLSGIDISAVI